MNMSPGKPGRGTPRAGPRQSPRVSIREMKAAKKREMMEKMAQSGMVEVEEDNREDKKRGKTALVYDERMEEHKNLWDEKHIENPERLRRVWSRCQEMGLVDRCLRLDSREASDEEIRLHHSESMVATVTTSSEKTVDELEEVCRQYDSVYLNQSSQTAARLAVGGSVDLVSAVLDGVAHNGMALVRPPGHHATDTDLCGFCVYNNVVIAAKHALSRGLKRVLIVDFDLHHGQATQFAFYNDPRVLYMSVHRYEDGSFWPHLRESNYDYIGDGLGKGFNVNVPLNATGLGPREYLAILHQVFLPIATEFRPQLVLFSAGYDAAIGCPEGEMLVTPVTYPHIVSPLSCLAGGRSVVLLEGGYCLDSLAESAALTLRCLLGDPSPKIDIMGKIDPSVLESISAVVGQLQPYWTTLQHRPVIPPPEISFNPPPDWPPAVFPTRDYYPQHDQATMEKWRNKINSLAMMTDLSSPDLVMCWVYHEEMGRHEDTEPHPECPDRIHRIYQGLEEKGILGRDGVERLDKVRRGDKEEICLVHDNEHWENMETLENMTQSQLDIVAEGMNSIYLNQYSVDCARLAVGMVLEVVDTILTGRARTGLAVVRPPGHHAEPDTPHGFCIFNNVAVAAKYALEVHGARRVLVVDWDVHHGNGIQHMFYNDDRVLYISLHRYDYGSFFPCSTDGGSGMVGEGSGKGFNVNIPFNGRAMGDAEYLMAFLAIVLPVAYEFSPDLVLVSSGFDAARGDPLGGYKLSPEMYGLMTYWLKSLSGGRVAVVLEGGYNLTSITDSAVMVARALIGDPVANIVTPGDAKKSAVETVTEVMEVHSQYWNCLKTNGKQNEAQSFIDPAFKHESSETTTENRPTTTTTEVTHNPSAPVDNSQMTTDTKPENKSVYKPTEVMNLSDENKSVVMNDSGVKDEKDLLVRSTAADDSFRSQASASDSFVTVSDTNVNDVSDAYFSVSETSDTNDSLTDVTDRLRVAHLNKTV